MRRQANIYSQLALGLLVGVPTVWYVSYNLFAPSGVMHNYKASSGAYLHYTQNWLSKQRSMTSIYRPEIEQAIQQSPLVAYTRKIEAKRADGSVPEGIHHPSSWH